VRQAAWAALAIADNSFDTFGRSRRNRPPLSPTCSTASLPQRFGLARQTLRARAAALEQPLAAAPTTTRGSFPSDDEREIRRAAIRALATMNRNPEAVFAALAA
jgi:hypothetical protein